MTAPLTPRDVCRLLLRRIRNHQRNAIGPAALVLSQADAVLSHGKPATLQHLRDRFATLRGRLGADANALRVLGIEFLQDVAEAIETGNTVQWVWANREANRAAHVRAHQLMAGGKQ